MLDMVFLGLSKSFEDGTAVKRNRPPRNCSLTNVTDNKKRLVNTMNEILSGPRIVVRKSVFIGTAVTISDENKAREFVRDMKRKDRKAAHVAFAYRIGENPVHEGMSDNGEPRGTAGLPLLMLLRHKQMVDTLVAVTRYWGGVKLGPGNLKRAYTEAAKQALEIE